MNKIPLLNIKILITIKCLKSPLINKQITTCCPHHLSVYIFHLRGQIVGLQHLLPPTVTRIEVLVYMRGEKQESIFIIDIMLPFPPSMHYIKRLSHQRFLKKYVVHKKNSG